MCLSLTPMVCFVILAFNTLAPIKKKSRLSYFISHLDYIIGEKKQQAFCFRGDGGGRILVLISLLRVQRNCSVRLCGNNKTGCAQPETCSHLASYSLIQSGLFMLFYYLILIQCHRCYLILWYHTWVFLLI